jgi:hypothetical protein
MIPFIILSILILASITGVGINYYKLKKLIPEQKESSFPIIDTLFNPTLRDQPQARKIQRRAIWFFCATLILVHAASLFYKQHLK